MIIEFTAAFLHWVGCTLTFVFFALVVLITLIALNMIITLIQDIKRRLRK